MEGMARIGSPGASQHSTDFIPAEAEGISRRDHLNLAGPANLQKLVSKQRSGRELYPFRPCEHPGAER